MLWSSLLSARALTFRFAGFAVSFVIQPMEAIKARLQIQYGGTGEARRFSGPVDCLKQVRNLPDTGPRDGITLC